MEIIVFGNSKKKIIDYLKSNKFDNNDLFFTSLDDSEIFNEILDEFKIKHANVNLNNNINIISEINNLYDNIYEQNNIFLWLSTTVGSKVFKKSILNLILPKLYLIKNFIDNNLKSNKVLLIHSNNYPIIDILNQYCRSSVIVNEIGICKNNILKKKYYYYKQIFKELLTSIKIIYRTEHL